MAEQDTETKPLSVEQAQTDLARLSEALGFELEDTPESREGLLNKYYQDYADIYSNKTFNRWITSRTPRDERASNKL